MDNTAKLTQWAINKIKTEYPDDIALLIACRGHETDNDGHGVCFDYFIPITQRGCELSQTFLVDGVGHDLYPRSWERMEKSTTLDEMTCVLANAEIRYARSQADIDRFCALQQTLKDNLKDPVFVYRKALERLDDAMDIYRSLMFEEKMYRARSEAGYIQHYLSQAVAYINGTYAESAIFTENQAYGGNASNRLYHCPELATVPDSFFWYAEQILTAKTIEELRALLHKLITVTKEFIQNKKPVFCEPQKTVDYTALADWYQELSLTWRRIRYFCDNNMVEEAFRDGCYLQSELLIIAPEFGLDDFNLLDSFDAASLIKLKLRSQKLEKVIRDIITENGVRINEYPTLDDFLASDAERK